MRYLRTPMFAALFVAVLSACGGNSPAASPAAPAEPPAPAEPASPAESPGLTNVDASSAPDAADTAAGDQSCGGCPHCGKKGPGEKGHAKKGHGKACGCGHCGRKAELQELCKSITADADVSVRNPTDSVALIFTAKDIGKIADVQARVQEFADMHHEHAKKDKKKHGKKRAWMKFPDADVTVAVANTASGAEIVLTPQDLETLPALRKLINDQAKTMSEPNCGIPEEPRPTHPPI